VGREFLLVLAAFSLYLGIGDFSLYPFRRLPSGACVLGWFSVLAPFFGFLLGSGGSVLSSSFNVFLGGR